MISQGKSTPEGGVKLLLPSATAVAKGNVFTPVCDSVQEGEVWPDPPQADPPGRLSLGRHPLGQTPGSRISPRWGANSRGGGPLTCDFAKFSKHCMK